MAADVGFGWDHLGAAWQVALVLAASAGLGVWSWRSYGPRAPAPWGGIARACRAAAVALLPVLIAGPSWYRTQTAWEPARVVVAVDRSASMARADGPAGQPRAQLAAALAAGLAGADPARMAVEIHGIGLGRGDGPRRLEPADLAREATGGDSRLGEDLDRLVADRRPDLLLIATDGRATGAPLARARLNPDGGRQVLILACGGERIDPELFIDEIIANRELPLGEVEPVTVRLSVRGAAGRTVALRLATDGRTLAEAAPVAPAAADPAGMAALEAVLPASFDREGEHLLTVEATLDGRTLRQELPVTVRERRLSVLLLDRTPRYEMRYLREALRRDGSATVHAYLADGRWRRWGDEGPDDHLPLLDGDLGRYDVIIVGDLDAAAFNDQHIAALERAVRRGGSGLIWIPGETGGIAAFAGTPAADLIPAALPDAAAAIRGYRDQRPRRLVRTPLAERLGLLDPGEGLSWAERDALLGALPVGDLKPAAEALAVDQDGAALVVDRPLGGGRTLLVAIDDAWRWRRGVGDAFLHRFHGQLLRHAAGGRWGGTTRWRLFANPRRVVAGEPVQLHLVRRSADVDAPPAPPTVRLAGPDRRELLVQTVPDGDGYVARLPAPPAGGWRLAVADGIDSAQVDAAGLLVLPPQAELRDPRADRSALDALARASGGQVFTDPAALLAALPEDPRLPRRSTSVLGLWDTWTALLIVVGLLAIDWAIRRANRLP